MFFDFPEIVIIFGVALVVLGPKKLPGTAAQVGRWVGRARAMARQFREQLEQEVNSVQNALDVNATHDASIKKRGTPGSVAPPAGAPSGSEVSADAVSSPDAEASPYGVETTSYDPSSFHATDMGWHPEYGEETALAPYGDPALIPQPPAEPPESQLSLQLDAPPGAAPTQAHEPR